MHMCHFMQLHLENLQSVMTQSLGRHQLVVADEMICLSEDGTLLLLSESFLSTNFIDFLCVGYMMYIYNGQLTKWISTWAEIARQGTEMVQLLRNEFGIS